MQDRPDFTMIKTYQEFSQYYWYRAELAEICKQLGLEYSGIKKELEEEIKQYFAGNVVQKKVPLKTKEKARHRAYFRHALVILWFCL